MTLAEIKAEVLRLPTIMNADDEIRIFQMLTQLPFEALLNDWKSFDLVIGRLYESHLDTFYEVSGRNWRSFAAFSTWLEGIASGLEGNRKASLMQAAEHFRIEPPGFTPAGALDQNRS
jgi:hypothetical protein